MIWSASATRSGRPMGSVDRVASIGEAMTNGPVPADGDPARAGPAGELGWTPVPTPEPSSREPARMPRLGRRRTATPAPCPACDSARRRAEGLAADAEPPDDRSQASSSDPPHLLTVPEAAELLRTTPKGIYAMVERGLLGAAVLRVGRRVLLRRQVLLGSTVGRLGPSPRRARR